MGGIACPTHHGAWADREALEQLRARLENAPPFTTRSLGEKVFVGLGEIVEDLPHRHPKEIDCPLRRQARDRPGRGRIGRDGLSEPQRRVDRLGYAGGNPPTPGRRRGYPQQPSRRVRYSQITRKPEHLVYRFHLLG